jgi:hypothetical protein
MQPGPEMTRTIVLDSGPLGLLAHTKLTDVGVQCTRWLHGRIAAGDEVVVPEISDYELRRELLRIGTTRGLISLESLLTVGGIRYLPIDTRAMRLAAELWADASLWKTHCGARNTRCRCDSGRSNDWLFVIGTEDCRDSECRTFVSIRIGRALAGILDSVNALLHGVFTR